MDCVGSCATNALIVFLILGVVFHMTNRDDWLVQIPQWTMLKIIRIIQVFQE